MNDNEAGLGTRATTPWYFWVIGVLALLWNAFAAVDFTASATKFAPYMDPYPQELKDYLYGLPIWRWIVWFGGAVGAFVGSVLLLLRRRLAVPVFLVSLVSAAITFGAGLTDKTAPAQAADPVFTVIILTIALGLLLYARWMAKRRVLR